MLKVINIHASYNKREILRGGSIEVKDREIAALIGPNGAGKSTLLKVVSGLLMSLTGSVHLSDQEITNLPIHSRVKLGIGYFLQGGSVFPHLRVCDNLELGGINLSNGHIEERTEEILKTFPALKDKFKVRAGLLSGGERQMLALGIVLMTRPKLLLLDEPSAGLAPKLVKEILDKILEINDNYGTSILLVEQNIKEGLRISQRVYLMKNGHIIKKGMPHEKITEEMIETAFFY
ncbi:MAG: ABC transporter ATP-binding protein [Nitrospirota bacterium]